MTYVDPHAFVPIVSAILPKYKSILVPAGAGPPQPITSAYGRGIVVGDTWSLAARVVFRVCSAAFSMFRFSSL